MMKVSVENEGTYLCKVNCNNSKVEKSFKINVYSFPRDPVLNISSVVAGAQSLISCTVPWVYPSERMDVKLLKDNKVLKEFELMTDTNYNGNVQLKNIILNHTWIPEKGDEGMQIVCEANMSFMDEETQPIKRHTAFTLNIAYPPSVPIITVFPFTTVQSGENISLSCVTESTPQATVWWTKMSGNAEMKIPSEGNGDLELLKVKPQDSGMYICNAENPAGKLSSIVDITVRLPPTNTRITLSPSTLVKEGDQVIIQCMSDAYPAPTLLLKEKTQTDQALMGTTIVKHIIPSATLDHSGSYVCEASNPVGKEIANISLSVQIPPKNVRVVVKPSKDVMEGDTITIICETHSYPLPTVLMKKVCAGNFTVQQAANGIFTLHNVTCNDTGTYEVSIINEAGNKTEVIEINVQARSYSSPQYSFEIPVIVMSLCVVSAGVIGLIIYQIKQVKLQGSYSLVKALRSRV
ncbi:hypothetical protein GDO86_007641 [Hymenochirus boettgeri]|uniref:Ig-like domain-containing protein n=1 Tax=Hymenochirus boettgeri TaxID=247094 RepID=A0A8T2IUG0_9PIPI|nr:hypothetical protein GDO86_007641 [Hymenochirus boettgeri]